MVLWSWIAFCLRTFVAAIFIIYACNKLSSLSNFAATIRRHRLIPDSFSGISAKVLSVVELALGLLFLFNIFPLIIGLAISILLVGFSGILLRAYFTPRLNIQDCGCSGADNRKIPIKNALFRNVLLISSIVVTIVVVGTHRNISFSLSPLIEVILLVCLLAGMLCMRIGLFTSLLNRLNVETISEEGRTSTITAGNRRSFIKWGIRLGIATLIVRDVLFQSTWDALARPIGPCPDDSAGCDCGPGGSGGWSGGNCTNTWNCSNGGLVPITTRCIIYCCGYNVGCSSISYISGEHQCGGC